MCLSSPSFSEWLPSLRAGAFQFPEGGSGAAAVRGVRSEGELLSDLRVCGGAVLVLACVPEPVRRMLERAVANQALRVFATVTDAEALFGG